MGGRKKEVQKKACDLFTAAADLWCPKLRVETTEGRMGV